MNEKEARDIILKETTGDHMCRADGYLEALDKAKGLEEALEKISNVTQFDHPKGQIIGSEEYEGAWLDCIEIAQEALAKYRSEK